MTLKTLGKTTWEELKIGEVFAWNGCWSIWMKISDTEEMDLADDGDNWNKKDLGIDEYFFCSGGECWELYKLPLATQQLWRCDK